MQKWQEKSRNLEEMVKSLGRQNQALIDKYEPDPVSEEEEEDGGVQEGSAEGQESDVPIVSSRVRQGGTEVEPLKPVEMVMEGTGLGTELPTERETELGIEVESIVGNEEPIPESEVEKPPGQWTSPT